MIRRGLFVSFIITVVTVFLFSGCAEKEVKPEEKPGAEKAAPAKPEGKLDEEALKARERELLAKAEEASQLQDIYFDYDKYNIRDDVKAILEKNAAWLKKNPGVKIQVEGHCDERGSNEYNLALGYRRARSARDYLVLLGVDPKRVSTISFGEEKPLDPGHNEEAWTKNRRGHFVILK